MGVSVVACSGSAFLTHADRTTLSGSALLVLAVVMGSGVKSRVRVGFGCHPLGFGSGSGVGPRVPFGFRVFSGFKK